MGYVSKRNARNAPEEITLPSGYHVTIRGALTLREEDALEEQRGTGSIGTAAIAALITEWDIDDEGGAILPITVATVGELDDPDAVAIGDAIKARHATMRAARALEQVPS